MKKLLLLLIFVVSCSSNKSVDPGTSSIIDVSSNGESIDTIDFGDYSFKDLELKEIEIKNISESIVSGIFFETEENIIVVSDTCSSTLSPQSSCKVNIKANFNPGIEVTSELLIKFYHEGKNQSTSVSVTGTLQNFDINNLSYANNSSELNANFAYKVTTVNGNSRTYFYVANGENLEVYDDAFQLLSKILIGATIEKILVDLYDQNIIYLAAREKGLIKINVYNKSNPVQVAQFLQDGTATDIFLYSNHILVAFETGNIYSINKNQFTESNTQYNEYVKPTFGAPYSAKPLATKLVVLGRDEDYLTVCGNVPNTYEEKYAIYNFLLKNSYKTSGHYIINYNKHLLIDEAFDGISSNQDLELYLNSLNKGYLVYKVSGNGSISYDTNYISNSFLNKIYVSPANQNFYSLSNIGELVFGKYGSQILTFDYSNLTDVKVDEVSHFAYVLSKTEGLFKVIINSQNPGQSVIETKKNSKDVFVDGVYAYVAKQSDGVWIYDISDPEAPVLKVKYNTAASPAMVLVKNSVMYIDDATYGLNIIPFDVEDGVFTFSDPIKKSFMDLWGVWAIGPISSLYLSGDYLFVTSFSSGVSIIDITQNTYPVLNRVNIYGSKGAYLFGSYLYLNINEVNNKQVFKVFDISDVYDLKELEHPDFNLAYAWMNNDIFVNEAGIFVANAKNGLLKFNHNFEFEAVFFDSSFSQILKFQVEKYNGKYAFLFCEQKDSGNNTVNYKLKIIELNNFSTGIIESYNLGQDTSSLKLFEDKFYTSAKDEILGIYTY